MLFSPIRRSLRLKLILVSVAIELVMLGLLLSNSLRLMDQSIEDQTELRINSMAPLMEAALSVPLFERDYVVTMELLGEIFSSSRHGFDYIAVLDDQGQLYALAGQLPAGGIPTLDASVASAYSDLIYDGASPLLISGMRVGEVRYGLSIASFVSSKNALFRQGMLIAAAEILLSILLLGFTGYLLTRHLGGLLRGTDAITRGHYDIHVDIKTEDEIGVLAGEFNLMAQAIRDQVTDLRFSQQALARSQAEFAAVFSSLADGVIFVDLDRICVMVNPAISQMFGYSADELIGRHLEFIYESREEFERLGRLLIRPDAPEELQPFEADYRRHDGSVFLGEIIVTKVKDADGELVGYVGIVRDITERREMEQALMEEKERAQVTLESIGDAVITTDNDGLARYLNPIAEQLTGWSTREAEGRPLAQVFNIINEKTRQQVNNPVQRCLRENRIIGLANHTVLISRDGTEYAIEDSAAPIRNRDGEILGVVMVFHDVSHARKLAQKLSWQASHDSLTGLCNRREFENRLASALQDARDNDLQHALLYMDLDQFKLVNDTCGHVAGDEMLRQLSERFQQRVRETDVLARLGGDEFGLLLEHCPVEQAERIANGIWETLSDFRFSWGDKSFTVGISIGLVPITRDWDNIATLMSAADVACYAAKDSGRNRLHIYKEDDAELAKRHGEMHWVGKIHQALEQGQFVLYCQAISPIHATEQTQERHCEMLIRLLDDDGRLIMPMAFLPAAERYNLMPSIDRWVVDTALQMMSTKSNREHCHISINLSGHSLSDDEFLDHVIAQVSQSGIRPEQICFEITETAAIANLSRAMLFIKRLKQLGCLFSLDDFGSGLSSFTYLKNLPVDFLKIDGSFVKDMINDPIDRAMVESINQLGHVLGIKTIAEFVENEQILQQLALIGVDYAQGYGIQRPIPFAELLP